MRTVACPHCDEPFNFRESSVGKLYRCRNCRGRIEFFYGHDDKPAFNHTWHLVLTLLTCGLWAIVWPLAWLAHQAKAPPVTVYARAR